jgi:hypothetical protein
MRRFYCGIKKIHHKKLKGEHKKAQKGQFVFFVFPFELFVVNFLLLRIAPAGGE